MVPISGHQRYEGLKGRLREIAQLQIIVGNAKKTPLCWCLALRRKGEKGEKKKEKREKEERCQISSLAAERLNCGGTREVRSDVGI